MNRHSYTVLEFDKLREEISNYSAIEENHYKILGLEPFKDFSSLNRELDVLRDFTDFLKFLLRQSSFCAIICTVSLENL